MPARVPPSDPDGLSPDATPVAAPDPPTHAHRRERGRGRSGPVSAVRAQLPDRQLDDVESVARIGSYSVDLESGRWVSSKGLDAIFGIDAGFERSVESWASLVHPADRAAMVAYFADDVVARGQPFDRQYRIVRADSGEERWVHGRGALKFDAAGRPVEMFGTIADISDRRAAQEALAASELRYAAIFEGTAEAILMADVATLRYRWVNAAACALLGYRREELLGLTVNDIHPPADRSWILAAFRSAGDGRVTESHSVPCVRKDGSVLLADIRGSTAMVEGVSCNIAFFTDVTELRRLEAKDRQLAKAVEQTSEAILITGATGVIGYANPAFERLSGRRSEEIIGGRPSLLGSPQAQATFEGMWRALVAGRSWAGDLVHRRPDGTERVAVTSISPVTDADGTVSAFVAIERDVTDERALARERERLATAVEQTSDSVIIADLAGTIEYVNPAFERASGYGRMEAVGSNPRILKSGKQSPGIYRAMWRRLTRGQSWSGTLINRRQDGDLYEEEATISPLRDPTGEINGYVAVKRDVTALRAAESGLASEFRERAAVAAALARLQPGPTAEATAAVICEALTRLPGVDTASIINFLDPRRAVPLAVAGPEGLPIGAGRPLPAARARYLYERAAQGPWGEATRSRPADGGYGEALARVGNSNAATGTPEPGSASGGFSPSTRSARSSSRSSRSRPVSPSGSRR